MAYEPNVWKCGGTITADQLNRLEQAVAELSQSGGESGGGLVLRATSTEQATTEECADGGTKTIYDRTYQEVMDAVQNGQTVMVVRYEDAIQETRVFYFADADDSTVRFFNGIHGNLYLNHNSNGQIYELNCNGSK